MTTGKLKARMSARTCLGRDSGVLSGLMSKESDRGAGSVLSSALGRWFHNFD